MPAEATPSQVERGKRIAALENEGKFDEAAKERGLHGVTDDEAVEAAHKAADEANEQAEHPEAVVGATGTEESSTAGRAAKKSPAKQ